jgi:hypothetical protein
MSSRDNILQNIRNNQPSSRELPAVPSFHTEPCGFWQAGRQTESNPSQPH